MLPHCCNYPIICWKPAVLRSMVCTCIFTYLAENSANGLLCWFNVVYLSIYKKIDSCTVKILPDSRWCIIHTVQGKVNQILFLFPAGDRLQQHVYKLQVAKNVARRLPRNLPVREAGKIGYHPLAGIRKWLPQDCYDKKIWGTQTQVLCLFAFPTCGLDFFTRLPRQEAGGYTVHSYIYVPPRELISDRRSDLFVFF